MIRRCPRRSGSIRDGNVIGLDLAGRPFGEGRRACPAPGARAGAGRRESTMFADLHRARRSADPAERVGSRLRRRRSRQRGSRRSGRRASASPRRSASPTGRARRRGDARPRRAPRAPAGADHRRRRERLLRRPARGRGIRARLEALGVAGINLEDRNGDPKHHADVIAAVKDATSLFVNARTDTYWLGDGTGDRESDAGSTSTPAPTGSSSPEPRRASRGARQPRRSPQCAVPARHDR